LVGLWLVGVDWLIGWLVDRIVRSFSFVDWCWLVRSLGWLVGSLVRSFASSFVVVDVVVGDPAVVVAAVVEVSAVAVRAEEGRASSTSGGGTTPVRMSQS
jgi:hypothetical protein